MKVNSMIIAVDIDGVLCDDLHGEFPKAKPIQENIAIVNKLYDDGHHIMILSSRGKLENKLEWAKKITVKQLEEWNVKYTEINWNQPFFDLGVNDKMFQSTHGLKKAFEKIGEVKF